MNQKSGKSKCRGIKNERDLTASFRRYLRNNLLPKELEKSCAIEFKFIKGDRLNIKSHFKPQQIPALLQAKHSCLYDKISDMSAGLKPFDAFIICGGAYAAIMFAGNSELHFIDVDDLNDFVKDSGCKSIKKEEIYPLRSFYIVL